MDRRIELKEDMLISQSIKVINIYKRYKDYNTIRRNLREAHALISYNISLQIEILNKTEEFNEGFINIIPKSTFHSAINLYAKWFKEVKNKTWLKKSEFFSQCHSEIQDTHDYIIQLRDKYIAHNEEDILGEDKVIIKIGCDDNKKNIEISSSWNEMMLPNSTLLEKIKKCIEIVHNKIDSENIPKYENLLLKVIKDNNIAEEILRNNIVTEK